jgi:tetratricopeptide (TPR) repeat protein
MPKAKFAAQRALAIDGNLAEAHAALGLVQSQFEWDWAAAERSYQRAIALSPSYPWVHLNYSLYLIQLGRTEQAIEEATVANRLDPLLVLMETSLAYILYLARRPDEAIAHCTKILELEPNSTVTHLTLGWAYTQKAMYEKAAAEFVEARRLTSKQAYPDGIFQLAHVYAITGKAQEAKQLLVEMDQISHRTYVDPLSIAIVYAGLGEKDHAYQWLEKAYQDRDESLLLLKVDPAFDSLHSDPRFKSLLGRIGLPQ